MAIADFIRGDFHVHSQMSTDGNKESTLQKLAMSAKNKGLSFLCITDHLDIGYPPQTNDQKKQVEEGTQLFYLDETTYFDALDEARKEYKRIITLQKGVEIGIIPESVREIEKWINTKPLDFVLGSTHVIGEIDPYYYPAAYGGGVDLYQNYFEQVYKNISLFTNYDSLAHIDYVARYGKGTYHPQNHREVLEAILEKLIKEKKALEVNTGGLRKGLSFVHPHIDILTWYKRMGGKYLTIGSDAHEPNAVGDCFLIAKETIAKAGFTSYHLYEKREPVEVPL